MKVLIFDTETTGFPKKPYTAKPIDNQPCIIQLGALLVELTPGVEKNIAEINTLIKPRKVGMISEGAYACHGISDSDLETKQPFSSIVENFLELCDSADYIVCHNADFDYGRMFSIEMSRLNLEDKWKSIGPKVICTMNNESVARFVGVSRGQGYKRPNLQELHQKLFGECFDNAHDAFADVTATFACFKALVRQRILILPPLQNENKLGQDSGTEIEPKTTDGELSLQGGDGQAGTDTGDAQGKSVI